MDLIADIISKNGSRMVQDLVSGAGMRAEQAEAFLPEVGGSLASALTKQAGNLDLKDLPSPKNVDHLLKGMDAAKLASRVGVTTEQGSRGLSTLVPMILRLLDERGGDDLLRMLGGAGGMGDALGKLKGLGKLFD